MFLLAAVTLSACDGGPPPDDAAVRDSAGVRIVENAGPESARRWTLSRRPLFRLGWRDDEPTFERINAGWIFGDGRVVVGDRRRLELFFLSPEGEVERVVGGRGEGPGEFGDIASVVGIGEDTVVAFDWPGRLSFFSDDGEFLGTEPWTRDVRRGAQNLGLKPIGAGPDGALLFGPFSRAAGPGPRQGWAWVRGPIVRWEIGAAERDTVATFDVFRIHTEGRTHSWSPFPTMGHLDASADGWVVGRSDRPEVRWYGPDGGLRQVARWAAEPWLLTDEIRSDYLEAQLGAAASHPELRGREEGSLREVYESMLDLHEGPLPFYSSLHADREGNVWLGHPVMPGEAREAYEVILSDGRRAGTVEVPAGLQILDVRGDRVLGVETDEWDVQAVVVYRVDRD